MLSAAVLIGTVRVNNSTVTVQYMFMISFMSYTIYYLNL